MSFLTDDFDPRLLLLTIEANYKPKSGYKPPPVSGLLVLSKVGLHFYAFDTRKRDGTLDRSKIQHYAFADRVQSSYVGFGMNPLRPLGQRRVGRLLHPETIYKLGYLASWGSGYGQIIAGVSNVASRVAARNASKAFVDAIIEAEQLAPPLPELPQVNPHIVRMSYFADASALGPALFFADRVLECAQLQARVARGPGFFERVNLRKQGWDKNHPLPIITPEELVRVKRKRAWLLIDNQRYTEVHSATDAEITLAYGVAQGLLGNQGQAASVLNKAFQADPTNPRIMAGAAWGLALQGRAAEARQMAASIPTTAREDRHALLLLGCAAESLDNKGTAMTFYLQSAALATGYFQGAVPCLRALALANKMDGSAALRAAQELIAILPEQREAWQGLAQAADRARNTPLARQARERITAMQGPLLLA